MNKRELAKAVAEHTDQEPRAVLKTIDGTLDVILSTVSKGETVALTGFAKFAQVKRPARTARNPATGAPVKVKAKTVAKITPLKGFKDVVLGLAPAPKLTKAPVVKATAVKKAAPVKKAAAPVKKAATKAAPVAKKATPAKKAAPVKKATPVKRAVKK